MIIAFPSSPFNRRDPDSHFANEYAQARDYGIDVALVDHDALTSGDPSEGVRKLPKTDDLVYRGWMMTSAEYAAFSWAALMKGASVRTSPAQYKAAHELPGWAKALEPHTAKTVWTSDSIKDLAGIGQIFGRQPVVLRDFVKSAKGHWKEACFIPDAADLPGVCKSVSRFLEIRGSDFTGQLVFREFETYVAPEIRTWWIDGAHELTTPHPDTPEKLPTEFEFPEGLEFSIRELRLPFITVDLAPRDDGIWRVIELGDGQVSDWPDTFGPVWLSSALARLVP